MKRRWKWSRNLRYSPSEFIGVLIIWEKSSGGLILVITFSLRSIFRYQTLLLRTYVDDNEFFRWCPAPNCEYAVECHVPQNQLTSVVPTVVCKCGHRFCFGCGLADHQPCVCFLVKKWLKKCQDDSETANWISANTKECTKCNTTIEKVCILTGSFFADF